MARSHANEMACTYGEGEEVKLVWEELPKEPKTSLPFRVRLRVEADGGERQAAYKGAVTISAVSTRACLSEGFEKRSLGLWTPHFLPGHYEHGFDSVHTAPGSTHALYLKAATTPTLG